MNRTIAIAVALASVLGVAAVVTAQADKATICHVPPGNPDAAHTITVGGPAAEAHMDDHGDTLGPCPGEEARSPGEQENPPGDTTNPPSQDPGPTTAATPGAMPAWIWFLLLVLAGIAAGTAVVLRQRQNGNL
jgi:hypothetical protein